MKMKLIRTLLMMIVCVGIHAQSADLTQKPYNPNADAKAELAKAITKAKQEHKHVFVQIGGNWCKWCLAFNNLVNSNAELKQLLEENYEVVHLNYSKENKNLDILARLKHPERFGFPVFVILDGDGNLLHTQNSAYLETKDGTTTGHDPKTVKDFLKGWTFAALNPETYK